MKVDRNKWRELANRASHPFSPDALRREENVFFVGGNLPERETLETLYDSHYQSNAALFHLTFGDSDSFLHGEALARVIKKNFHAHLVGRIDYAAPPQHVERAYAAGIDILDIPLNHFSLDGASEADQKERLRSLDCARSVFPRWGVASTLLAGVTPATPTVAGIDALLELDVVPLVALAPGAGARPFEEISQLFNHLQAGWNGKKAAIKPLLPLILVSTPLVRASAPGKLRGFIDLIEDRRLLATSDLRRLLRVKEVEQSYASSGL